MNISLTGPEKIKISDDQLEQLLAMYKSLQENLEKLITEFFTPFEMMHSEGVFTGAAAETFAAFCQLVKNYLEARLSLSLQEIRSFVDTFKTRINEVDSFNDLR
ncbi:hypothetical protein SAMN05421736_1381 [Evansella caseinilytica]|uniref:Uncharacterized protein n=1 Tax=Evansella caseinilytica TaxID=1503961 RepID=A0A1H3V255_9BACI|nr:hypothetical protein [Evansella caseinilytica]SDZ68687.1 hypothetical protein SAMN05421736_1381 [Evansella caseinilytica]